MKGKNKKLIVIVSCLLLVGGISFAYFIASTLFSGEGSSVSGTTATINDAELRVEGTLEFNDLDIYPGHQNVSSVKVTAIGDNTLIPYHLVWNGTNTFNTLLNYTAYGLVRALCIARFVEVYTLPVHPLVEGTAVVEHAVEHDGYAPLMQLFNERCEVLVGKFEIARRSDARDIARGKTVVLFPVLHRVFAVVLHNRQMGIYAVVILRVILVV